MFRGNHPTRVDEKGRLKVPAEFKRTIDESYGGGQFYITSRDGRVAEIYPFEEWQRIEEKLAKVSNFNPAKKKFLDRVDYYGQMVEIDNQGRDWKSTRLNSSHLVISYAVFCLKKKKHSTIPSE